MIISFAWTTAAFLAGQKHRTRREWSDEYASRFHVCDTAQAWNQVPRVKGAHKIGELVIEGMTKESNSMMTDKDYELEGFAFMEEKGLKVWGKPARQAFDEWRADKDQEYWVVDFRKKDWRGRASETKAIPLTPPPATRRAHTI